MTDTDPVLWHTGCGLGGTHPCLDVFITELGLEASEQPTNGNSRCGHGGQAGLGPGRSHTPIDNNREVEESRMRNMGQDRASVWKTGRGELPGSFA